MNWVESPTVILLVDTVVPVTVVYAYALYADEFTPIENELDVNIMKKTNAEFMKAGELCDYV